MNRISELKILEGVPFEKDTNTSMTFDSLSDQVSYFQQFAVKSFTNLSFVKGFLYKKVRLECDIDDVYNANYLMWKNNDGKWFYAYITGIEFISEVTVEINFDMDYIQSYMGDIVFDWSYVEREHLNEENDVPDFYRNKEDKLINSMMAGAVYDIIEEEEEIVDDFKLSITFKPNLILKELLGTGTNNWQTTQQGGTYQVGGKDTIKFKEQADYILDGYAGIGVNDKFYSGCLVRNLSASDSTDFNTIKNTIFLLETTGYKIINMCMIPSYFTTGQIHRTSSIVIKHNPFYRSGTTKKIGKYTPINNRLFSYPLIKLNVSNNQGKIKEYKYDNFYSLNPTTHNPEIVFRNYEVALGGYTSNLVPVSYNDDSIDSGTYYDADSKVSYDYGISIDNPINTIWNGDSFLSNLIKTGISLGVSAFGIATGNVAVGLAGGKGITDSVKDAMNQEISFTPDLYNTTQQLLSNDKSDNTNMQTTNTVAQVLSDNYGYRFKHMAVCVEKLMDIDYALFQYGVQSDFFHQPYILSRTRFNYVKINKPMIRGNIPIEARQYVIKKLQEGYTFWHDKTYIGYGNGKGNYKNDYSTKTLTNRGTIF